MSVTSPSYVPNSSPSSSFSSIVGNTDKKKIIFGIIAFIIINAIIAIGISTLQNKKPEDKDKIAKIAVGYFFALILIEIIISAVCYFGFKSNPIFLLLFGSKLIEILFQVLGYVAQLIFSAVGGRF